MIQVFTNADKVHAAQVIYRLGLEECFEGIICFETLNPHLYAPDKNPLPAEEATKCCSQALNLNGRPSSKTKILCKPSIEAIEAAIRIANVEPKKTVRY